MNDLYALMDIEQAQHDEMIVISPKDFFNLIHDWIADTEGYEPYGDVDDDGDMRRLVGQMRRSLGGEWISRQTLKHAIKDLVVRAGEE